MNTTTIALIGRPNVGKSTLFNRLTGSRQALVHQQAGTTRDRIYGHITINDQRYCLIDTGGLSDTAEPFSTGMLSQVEQALADANLVYFVICAEDGINAADHKISAKIRRLDKRIMLLINKSEKLKPAERLTFYELGLTEPLFISAKHNQGIDTLLAKTCEILPKKSHYDQIKGISVAILGKPNAGKSTLINTILAEDRLLTSSIAGTTRDSIYIPFRFHQQRYTLIDTAGIRRRRSVHQSIEKFSIVKAIEAIERSDVALLVIDGQVGISEQDATLLGMIVERGRAVLIVVNKWDALDGEQKQQQKRVLALKLSFIDYASIHFISAINGSGVKSLFGVIQKACHNAQKRFTTALLNQHLIQLTQQHPPPLIRSKRIKLKYIHQIDQSPPTFLVHGNQAKKINQNYQHYLINGLRRQLKLSHTPIKLIFKDAINPFADKKNSLNQRQIKKKRRLMKFVKR